MSFSKQKAKPFSHSREPILFHCKPLKTKLCSYQLVKRERVCLFLFNLYKCIFLFLYSLGRQVLFLTPNFELKHHNPSGDNVFITRNPLLYKGHLQFQDCKVPSVVSIWDLGVALGNVDKVLLVFSQPALKIPDNPRLKVHAG